MSMEQKVGCVSVVEPRCFWNSGAGSVNPPVLYRFETGLMIPALPIWSTEEFEIPSIFKN